MADLSNADGRRELTVDPPPHQTVKGCASASANRPETLVPSRVFVLGRPRSLYFGIKLLIIRLEMMLSSFRVSLFVYAGLLFECFFLIGNTAARSFVVGGIARRFLLLITVLSICRFCGRLIFLP